MQMCFRGYPSPHAIRPQVFWEASKSRQKSTPESTALKMSQYIPKTVYLAESSVQLIGVFACLQQFGEQGTLVLFENSHTYGDSGIDELLAAGRERFSQAAIIKIQVPEYSGANYGRMTVMGFLANWRHTIAIRDAIVEQCQRELGIGLPDLRRNVTEVYFNHPHLYVLVFLGLVPSASFITYPHGFDQPRIDAVANRPYLYRKRSFLTLLSSLPEQLAEFRIGMLLRSILGRPTGVYTALPFAGVDRVVTYRSGVNHLSNKVVRVTTLESTLRWLLANDPWKKLLAGTKPQMGKSVIVLLPECNRSPIWEMNRHFGFAHRILLREVLAKVAVREIVLKAHVRSDTSAARWLCDYLAAEFPNHVISILPVLLSRIPIEALALADDYVAACSLGSVSLPKGLGFGMPHYVVEEAARMFDSGWTQPFWHNYEASCRVLEDEGICTILAGKSTSSPIEKRAGSQSRPSGIEQRRSFSILRPVANAISWFSDATIIFSMHRILEIDRNGLAPNEGMKVSQSFVERFISTQRKAGWSFVSLDEICEQIRQRGCPAKKQFVITLDDGYRDNYEQGLPLFKSLNVPFCVYFVTDFVSGLRQPWWFRLDALVNQWEIVRLPDGTDGVCSDRLSRTTAFLKIREHLLATDESDPYSKWMLDCLAGFTDLNEARIFMDADQVKSLSAEPLATIGAHTVTHRNLRLLSTDALGYEMSESKGQLETLISRPVSHFAYPYGGPGQCGPREYAAARDAGFRTAVTTIQGMLGRGGSGDLMALPRIHLGEDFSLAHRVIGQWRRRLRGAVPKPFSSKPLFPTH